jgi:hypothetical protein
MKENKSSKIVVAIIGILGFLGLALVGRKIYSKNVGNKIDPDNNSKNIEENIIDNSKPEIQDKTIENNKPSSDSARNKESRISFKDVDDLLLYAIKSVLNSENFASPSDFMSNVITIATVMCENDEWFEYFPKDIDELKKILEIHNLLQEYNIKLYKNYV